MYQRIAGTLVLVSLFACTQQQSADGLSPDARHAIAYLKNDPAVTSNDEMTFSMAGFWSAECKRNSKMWQLAVQACGEPGGHPPVCQIITAGTGRCP